MMWVITVGYSKRIILSCLKIAFLNITQEFLVSFPLFWFCFSFYGWEKNWAGFLFFRKMPITFHWNTLSPVKILNFLANGSFLRSKHWYLCRFLAIYIKNENSSNKFNLKLLSQVFELKLVLYCICIEPLWRKPTPWITFS